MKLISVDQSVPAFDSYRATRVRSLFNVTADAGRRFTASASLPVDEEGWQIGLIVGPSGSGKSSMGRAAWGDAAFHEGFAWGPRAIIDEVGENESFDDAATTCRAGWSWPFPRTRRVRPGSRGGNARRFDGLTCCSWATAGSWKASGS